MLPILGKLLVLPANVRLDWKVFARCKRSSLFGLIISNEEKKFYNIDSSMERDKFMSPQEALEFGLIDDILQHPPKPGMDEPSNNNSENSPKQG